MTLRACIAALAISSVALMTGPARAAAEAPSIEVWKSATCDCCIKWVEHLEANGFVVKVNAADTTMLRHLKRQAGIGKDLASCHTAKIDGYVVEGHVPASDVKRLVAERPDAVGLTVPGMPIGSPGMERGDEIEPYDVILIKRDRSTEIFAKH